MNNSCPICFSKKMIKNGSTHHTNQKYLCKECGIQFVDNNQKKVIWNLTYHWSLLIGLEKIPLAGIARALNIYCTWLQDYVNKKYDSNPG